MTDQRFEEIQNSQWADKTYQEVKRHCRDGCPEKLKLSYELEPYQAIAGKLTVHEDLIMIGNRLVIPHPMRREILERIHQGHQGITKCRLGAKESVWWSKISSDIERVVTTCPECSKERINHAEPMIESQLPKRPWQKNRNGSLQAEQTTLSTNNRLFFSICRSFETHNNNFSQFYKSTKVFFACHGIQETVISDTGAQFSSGEFEDLAQNYEFLHITSSPRYPQSNGGREICKDSQEPST